MLTLIEITEPAEATMRRKFEMVQVRYEEVSEDLMNMLQVRLHSHDT